MVNKLKESVEGLEPPICPKCHIDMQWYRSELVSERGTTAMIAHFFFCGNCGQRAEIKAEAVKPQTPPSKLSRPRRRFSKAA